MNDIQIGSIGKIVAGADSGKYIKVVDDHPNTGGFLILIADDSEFRRGHDDWVLDEAALARYFAESDWEVDWSN